MWSKKPIKLPFLPAIQTILGTVKAGADSLSALLDTALIGLNVVKTLFLAKADLFALLFSALITELENLINDTFNTGIYSITIDPRKISVPNIRNINLSFPTSIDVENKTTTQIQSEIAAEKAANLDPVLTYEGMLFKAKEKKKNWKFDNFGIPLMTPSQCVSQMIASFEDAGDPNRPIFSDNADICAVGFIVSAPDIDQFAILAQGFNALLGIDELLDLLNDIFRRTNNPAFSGPKGGVAPDWTALARLSDFEFMRQQRDALLSAVNQLKGLVQGADSAIVKLIEIITKKVKDLDDLVEEFSALITKLQSALNANGIYVFDVDGPGGTNRIKTELRQTLASANDLFQSENGYSFGFLMVGGGPSLISVRLIRSLLLDIQNGSILSGANEKQSVSFSLEPAAPDSSITIDGTEIPLVDSAGNKIDLNTVRRAIQNKLNTTRGSEIVVLMSTKEEKDGQTLVPGQGEKDGLGFSVEWQGADGKTSQPLLDFSDQGIDEVQEICFSEQPTSGSWTIQIGTQETAPIPFNATASQIQEIINNTAGVYNKATVQGSYASCFFITYNKIKVPPSSISSNTLVGLNPVTITLTVQQPGANPANNLKDANNKPIEISVTRLVTGQKNDLCE